MGFIFVYDTDFTVIVREEETIHDTIHRQQQGTSCWEKKPQNNRMSFKTGQVMLVFDWFSLGRWGMGYN